MMADNTLKVVCLLLSGGAGTRLWPMSTERLPKQFLPLFGARSLYQSTLLRLRQAAVDEVWVIANRQHAALLADQAQGIGLAPPRLVLEPARRDSAAAIAAGVAAIRATHGDGTVIVVLPCDHMIRQERFFAETLGEGVALARSGYLATFGIVPTSPSTEFGYLQRGSAVPGFAGAFRVERFHEKPARQVAEGYLSEGGYYWNSGMFVFRAAEFVAESQRHMSDIWTQAETAVVTGVMADGALMLDEGAFAQARKTSIDYALFEKSDKVAVTPARFDWSDVGNWTAAHDALQKDQQGNVAIGKVTAEDATGSLLIGDGVPVVAIGVSDLVIVATAEGVFVAPRSRAADIKRVMDAETARRAARVSKTGG
jgi:mannose-1-phosphate guanylyltransferase / mannose-6-phosphate isomerase